MTRRRRYRAALLVAVWVLPSMWMAWPHTVDDAYITARYALRLWGGSGYTYNDGAPTDGVSGPAWLLPMWLGAWAEAPVTAAKVTGVLCTTLSIAWVAWRVRGKLAGRLACALLGVACALSLPLGVWAVAGLETGLATLCATAMVLGATRRPTPAAQTLGLGAAVAAWTRPELALLAAGTLGFCATRDRVAGARAFAWAAVSACALLAFRVAMFGDWLPLSARAKLPQLSVGVSYALRSWLGMVGLPAAVGFGWLAFRGRGDERLLVWLAWLHLLAVVLAGGDWMPAARLLVPVLPACWMVASLAAARHIRSGRRWVAGYALVSLLWLAPVAGRELPAVRAAGLSRAARSVQLAGMLRDVPGPIALVDIGRVGVSLPGRRIVDLGGLTDPEIAGLPGGHLEKRLPRGLLRRRGICQLVLHTLSTPRVDAEGHLRTPPGYPVERRVLQDPWIRGHFRVTDVLRYAPGYHYVLLRPSRLNTDTCRSSLREARVRWHH